MCNCVRLWVENPEMNTPHRAYPVTCNEYVSDLKELLIHILAENSSADSPHRESARKLLLMDADGEVRIRRNKVL